LGIVITWKRSLAASLIVLALSGCDQASVGYKDLLAHNEVIDATVVSKNCNSKAGVYYEFLYHGKKHIGQVESEILDCHSALLGQSIKVYFNPVNPSIHTTLTPARANEKYGESLFSSWSEIMFAVLVALAMPFAKAVKKRVGKT